MKRGRDAGGKSGKVGSGQSEPGAHTHDGTGKDEMAEERWFNGRFVSKCTTHTHPSHPTHPLDPPPESREPVRHKQDKAEDFCLTASEVARLFLCHGSNIEATRRHMNVWRSIYEPAGPIETTTKKRAYTGTKRPLDGVLPLGNDAGPWTFSVVHWLYHSRLISSIKSKQNTKRAPFGLGFVLRIKSVPLTRSPSSPLPMLLGVWSSVRAGFALNTLHAFYPSDTSDEYNARSCATCAVAKRPA